MNAVLAKPIPHVLVYWGDNLDLAQTIAAALFLLLPS
jgi:hypothetical protein